MYISAACVDCGELSALLTTLMAKCGARSLLAMVLALWRTQVALCACVQDGPCKCTSDQGTIDLNPIQGNPP